MTAGEAGNGDRRDMKGGAAPGPSPRSSGRGRRWFIIRVVVMAVGVLMLAGAVVFIWSQHDRIASALSAMSRPRAVPIVILVGSMVLTIVVTGIQFQLLLARHRLPALEMQGLIAGSALLNFLPLKAGLLGRLAYHQVVHGIRPLETARAMILARGAGLFVIGLTALALLCRDLLDGPLWAWALIPAALPGWFIMPRFTRTAGLVVVLKYVDLLLMAVRYHCAFSLMSEPVDFSVCMALASIGMLAGAIPFLTGGLGLREWLVGWLTTMLVALPTALELGVLADLINRAAELVVLVPVGGAAVLWLRPRFLRSLARAREAAAQLQSAESPEVSLSRPPGREP